MEHFIKRLSACIIDFIVVFLLTAIVNNLLFIPISLLKVQIISAYYPYVVTVLVTLAYFTIMEAKTNKTIGKSIMKLYVSDEEGYLSYFSAFVRNITKCFWVPLVFDVILGKLLGLPSRLFDKLAGTDVYADDELEVYDENKLEESAKQIDDKNNFIADDKKEYEVDDEVDDMDLSHLEVKEEAKSEVKSDEDIIIETDEDVNKEVVIEARKNSSKTQSDLEDMDLSHLEVKDEPEIKSESDESEEDNENNEPEFIFADDTDIETTYHKKEKVKKDIKDKQSTKKEEIIKEDIKDKEQNSESTPYEDEILDLIIEEDESDSFVELTKDDF